MQADKLPSLTLRASALDSSNNSKQGTLIQLEESDTCKRVHRRLISGPVQCAVCQAVQAPLIGAVSQ